MSEFIPVDKRKIRILMAKVGLDGHDRGVKVVSRALRDAGFEVIYTGLRRTPEEIVNTAIQEDVNYIGISILSGAHNVLITKLMQLLSEAKASDIKVLVGGIIPEKDILKLKQQGVAEVFRPGSLTSEIIEWIKNQS
jgi:methylmalonyl-CoA mutase, C-terminal domain